MRDCVRVCACVRIRACLRACLRACCLGACVCVRAFVHVRYLNQTDNDNN